MYFCDWDFKYEDEKINNSTGIKTVHIERFVVLGDPQMEGDWRVRNQGKKGEYNIWFNDNYFKHIVSCIAYYLKPNYIFVLGDLFSSQYIKDEEFSRRVERYRRIFSPLQVHQGEDHYKLYNITGNHDIGYAGESSRRRIDRFEESFGKVNDILEIDGHIIGIVNSINLDKSRDSELHSESWDHLRKLKELKESTNSNLIIMTHIPLYKKYTNKDGEIDEEDVEIEVVINDDNDNNNNNNDNVNIDNEILDNTNNDIVDNNNNNIEDNTEQTHENNIQQYKIGEPIQEVREFKQAIINDNDNTNIIEGNSSDENYNSEENYNSNDVNSVNDDGDSYNDNNNDSNNDSNNDIIDTKHHMENKKVIKKMIKKKFRYRKSQNLGGNPEILFPNNHPKYSTMCTENYFVSENDDGEILEQSMLTKETSDFILEELKPIFIFNGHDHDGCIYQHLNNFTIEYTIRSMMGDYGGYSGLFEIRKLSTGEFQYNFKACPFYQTKFINILFGVTIGWMVLFIFNNILLYIIEKFEKRRKIKVKID